METPLISSRNSNSFQTPMASALPFVCGKKDTIVDRHIVDGVCLERVEASGRRAVVYRRNTNIAFRRYEVDFDILNVAYVSFAVRGKTLNATAGNGPHVVEVHLCIVGEWRIDFHELVHEGHCMLTLPFRICMAHRCGFSECFYFISFDLSEPDSAQLFSLTHPYNEFFPVVSKFRGDTQCHYAFRGRRISLVADSWRADNVERCETIVGECLETGQRLVFLLRACSREEKNSAKNEMWMDARGFFNLSITSATAAAAASAAAVASNAAHSFLSPNFFNTKFLSGCRGTAATPSVPSSSAMDTISPMTSQTSFASAGRVSFGGVSFMGGGGGGATTASGGLSSRITPIRRHGMQTRSMAAAHSLPRSNTSTAISAAAPGGGNCSASSLGVTCRRIDFASNDAIIACGGVGVASNSVFSNMSAGGLAGGGKLTTAPSMASLNSAEVSIFNRRRSMNSNTLLQFALTQQRRQRCTSTPIIDVEAERLLAFGSASTMECAVEFCLEWLEDAPPTALAAGDAVADVSATSSASSSSMVMDCSPAAVTNVTETPSQPLMTGSQRLASTAKKPAAAAILERRARQQRLQMLDDMLLNKANASSIHAWKLRESSASMLQSEEARYCRQRWNDNRLQNVRQMLDSSKVVLIPAKLDARVESGDTSPSSSTGVDERAQQVQFVMTTALKTVTRPFGQALFNFATVRPIANQPFILNPICLSGKVSPSEIQIDYPTGEASSKAFIEWASFYNGVAHGLAVLGFDSFTRHCARRTRKSKAAGTTAAATKDFLQKLPCRQHSFGSASAGTTSFSTVRRRQSTFSDLSTFLGSPIGLASEGGGGADTTQGTLHLAEELANFRRESRQPNSTRVVLDWDWLNMNLKAHRDLPPVEAGFLFAAGLSGHIPITNHDVYNYVANYKNKFCVMAILLGWAVAHRGTSDIVVHKVLITHSPFLMQPTLCDFRFEPMIQTAALIGLGFLFAETMNLSLSGQLVNQMSRETFDTEQGVADLYSFVLAAGFAVGLINLGKGTVIMRATPAVASTQLSLAERLIKLLNGGERRLCYVHYDRAHRCPDVSCVGGRDAAGGIGNGCIGVGDSQRRLADGTTGDGSSGEHSFNSTSSHVRQMSRINVHLASPAACAALALLYLRTNDAWISDALSVPDTMPAIERIRPDVLMLRVVAKCLVNFDAIGASIRFIEAQIPSTIRRYATHFVNNTSKKREAWWARVVDVSCVAQETLYGRVESEATAAADADENNINVDVFRRLGAVAGRNCINACVNVCAVSLALVMAGSGDLPTLKLLRKIRNLRRQDTGSNSAKSTALHSLHVATNMAIGMLCLGNGRLSLDKSDMSIASLFISFFPIFPHSLLDNRVYLQPLRFLWTLAVETRFLTAVDAETLAPITVSVRIIFKNGKQSSTVGWTPFILPPLGRIATITLGDVPVSAAGDRRTVGDALFDYASVELNMRSARDVRKLGDVLNRCYGRLPMRRRAGRADADETLKPADFDELDKLVADTLNLLKSRKFGLEEEMLSGDDNEEEEDEAMDVENVAPTQSI